MKPNVEIRTTAGTLAAMSVEQFKALQDNIVGGDNWLTVTDPVHVTGHGDYIGVHLPSIFVGIEKDGYTHS